MRFSSNQVTAIVIAGCVTLVLVPTAAGATGSTLATIFDPSNSKSARVSSDGRLLTTTDGAVSTQEGIEETPFARFGRAGNNADDRIVIAGPTTKTIALTSLTASATGGPVAVRIRAVEPSQGTDGSCDTGNSVSVLEEDMAFIAPAEGSISVPFGSPLIATPATGKSVCLVAHADTTYIPDSAAVLSVSGSGYLR
jgi:hypothetical protein